MEPTFKDSNEIVDFVKFMLYFSEFRPLLKAACEREFSGENYDFLIAVQQYRVKPSKKKALQIIDEFGLDSSPRPINITSAQRAELASVRKQIADSREAAQRKNIIQRIATSSERKVENLWPNLFDNAEMEILRLLASDTVGQRFAHTDRGKEVVEAFKNWRKLSADEQFLRGALDNLGTDPAF